VSVESIMADHVIAARSERAVYCAASRWGLALGIGSPFTILLPLEDRLSLECTAELRGMSTNALAFLRLPQSASCSENSVIPSDVFGQTLRGKCRRKRAWPRSRCQSCLSWREN
jgi:hypothetical protein